MDVKARSSRTRGPIWTLEVVIGGHCYRLLTHVFEVLIKLPPPKVISGLLSNIQKGGPLLRNSWSLSIWTFGDTLMSSEISAIRHEELFLLRHVDSKKIVQILATLTEATVLVTFTTGLKQIFLWLTGIFS